MIMIPEQYHAAFNVLVQEYGLSDKQQEQIWIFLQRLISENEKYNLTAITDINKAIQDHLYDSLSLLKIINTLNVQSIADVGSGGGFPGIPLAIALPSIQFCLIEVNLKKVAFLESIAQELGLSNVSVVSYDFRSFIRAAPVTVDLFIARASLEVDELLRIFKPSSAYKQARFVYWASGTWTVSSALQKQYFYQRYEYTVGVKQRALCLFVNNSDQNIQR